MQVQVLSFGPISQRGEMVNSPDFQSGIRRFEPGRCDQMALSSIGRKTASLAEKPGSTPGSVTKCPRGAIGRHDWFRSNIMQVQLLLRTPKCLRSTTENATLF